MNLIWLWAFEYKTKALSIFLVTNPIRFTQRQEPVNVATPWTRCAFYTYSSFRICSWPAVSMPTYMSLDCEESHQKPREAQGECASSTQDWSASLNPKTSCYEISVLTTAPSCRLHDSAVNHFCFRDFFQRSPNRNIMWKYSIWHLVSV